jgi:hypothetical protein
MDSCSQSLRWIACGARVTNALTLVVAALCVACGADRAQSSSHVSGSGDETGMPSACGDGERHPGVFCFERIDVPQVSPAYMVAVGGIAGAPKDLALCAGSAPSRTIRYASVAGGRVDVVESGLPCMTNIDFPYLIPGRFDPDFGIEVVTATKKTLQFHRRAGSEILVREEPRECGEITACNIPASMVDVVEGRPTQIVAFDHAPGSPDDSYVAPVLLERSATEWVLAGSPLPAFETHPGYVSVAIVDLDLDGTPEVVFGSIVDGAEAHAQYDATAHQVVVARPQDGELLEQWRGPAGTVPLRIALADVDGDDLPDLVVQSTDALVVLPGSGDDTFSASRLIDLGDYDFDGDRDRMYGIAVGDFDGDGLDAEIAVIVGPIRITGGQGRDLVIVDNPLGDATVTTILPGWVLGGLLVAGDLAGNHVDDLALATEAGETSTLTVLLATP